MSKISFVYGMQTVTNPLQPKEILDMAHANTIFHQVLSLVPRSEFEALARKYSTGRSFRVFSRWNQFACLFFIHTDSRPFRELTSVDDLSYIELVEKKISVNIIAVTLREGFYGIMIFLAGKSYLST